MKYFHGGKAGLQVGDRVLPAPPHVEDGCPVCAARAEGHTLTVREYRAWALSMGEQGQRVLKALEGADPDAPMDPPSAKQAVYVTSDERYAAFYASRSGHGDLYRVLPVGPLEPAPEDHFPAWTCAAAVVVEVIRRGVVRSRKERRELEREWKKADRRAARRTA